MHPKMVTRRDFFTRTAAAELGELPGVISPKKKGD
jgi:hypothetical protein